MERDSGVFAARRECTGFLRKQVNRNIFKYCVDGKEHYRDPLEILENLYSHPDYGKAEQDRKSELVVKQIQACRQLAEITREVFHLPELNLAIGAGWTQAACLALHDEYFDFLNEQKKSTEPGPILLPSTA